MPLQILNPVEIHSPLNFYARSLAFSKIASLSILVFFSFFEIEGILGDGQVISNVVDPKGLEANNWGE